MIAPTLLAYFEIKYAFSKLNLVLFNQNIAEHKLFILIEQMLPQHNEKTRFINPFVSWQGQ